MPEGMVEYTFEIASECGIEYTKMVRPGYETKMPVFDKYAVAALAPCPNESPMFVLRLHDEANEWEHVRGPVSGELTHELAVKILTHAICASFN